MRSTTPLAQPKEEYALKERKKEKGEGEERKKRNTRIKHQRKAQFFFLIKGERTKKKGRKQQQKSVFSLERTNEQKKERKKERKREMFSILPSFSFFA